jgi:hypothetical protein
VDNHEQRAKLFKSVNCFFLLSVIQIDKGYPRKIGDWWLGCPEEKVGQLSDATGTGSGSEVNVNSGKVGGSEQMVLADDIPSTRSPNYLESLGNGCERLHNLHSSGTVLLTAVSVLLLSNVLFR